MERDRIGRPTMLSDADNALAVEIERHMRRHGLDWAAVAIRCRLSKRTLYRLKSWIKGSTDPDFTTLAAMNVAERLGIKMRILVGDEARI